MAVDIKKIFAKPARILIPLFAIAAAVQFYNPKTKFTPKTEPADTKADTTVLVVPAPVKMPIDTTATDSTASPNVSVSADFVNKIDFIAGDSLASDLMNISNTPGIADGTLSPQELFEAVQTYISDNPNALSGKNVLVAVANSSDPIISMTFAKRTARLLKEEAEAANVIVLGFSTTRTDLTDPVEANTALKSFVESNGLIYGGPITNAGSGNARPTTIKELRDLLAQAEKPLQVNSPAAKKNPAFQIR